MSATADDRRCDVLLQGGSIVDGSGQPAYPGDVAIRGERIVAVGDCGSYRPVRRIDVSGHHVCPGFIDVHAHDDQLLFDDPAMTPKVSQGVTTVVVGNCGVSLAPLVRDTVPAPLSEMGRAFRFATFAQYVDELRRSPAAINAACLVGHTTLRVATMADLDRRATEAELDAMRALCGEALEAGAIGVSSGVFYPPARAADWSEVAALAALSGAAGGVYTAHLRDEGDRVIEAIDEACKVAAAAGTPLVLSHHKVAGRANFGRSRETLEHIGRAAAQQPVSFDVYPYTAGASMLSEALCAAAARTIVTWSEPHPEAAGRELGDVARSMGLTQADAIQALLPGGAIYFLMHDADVQRILSHPEAMIGSDGVATQHPHPRLWGAFTRVLGHYSRDAGLFSFEEAVRRMTSLPAARFGFADRGILRPGAYADVSVIDALQVADVATYDEPRRASRGVASVYVAGQCVWDGVEATGARPGRLVRRYGMQAGPA